MRKRVKIVLAIVPVAIACVVGCQILSLRQPVYQGKTLHSWLLRCAKSHDYFNQVNADKAAELAILHIGTNGLPTLLAWAGATDSSFKKKMIPLLSAEVCLKVGVYSANDYHAAASLGFAVLKSIAKPAVPGLIKLRSKLVRLN